MNKYQVLLVDDQPLDRYVIREMALWNTCSLFEVCGEASSAEEALRMMKEKDVDVVITDIIMPEIDGLMLLKRIVKEHPEVRVILMSGLRDFEYARLGLVYGACDYLVKPIYPEQFEMAMHNVLRQLGMLLEKPERELAVDELLSLVCEGIRAPEDLSDKDVHRYISTACRRPGFKEINSRTYRVRCIRVILERLLMEYTCGEMQPLAEAFIGRYWHEGEDLKGSCLKSLREVQRFYRHIILPESRHELIKQTVRLAIGRRGLKKTVESIARELFVSRAHLSQVFKKECGITVAEYLVRVRMYRAQALLISKQHPIADVAHFLGYMDEKHFSKIFKAHAGLLPREYRKAVWNNDCPLGFQRQMVDQED